MTAPPITEVFRLEVSRDELNLITAHLSNIASLEMAARPQVSPIQRLVIAAAVGKIGARASKGFVQHHGLNALLDLVQRLAILSGHAPAEPFHINEQGQ